MSNPELQTRNAHRLQGRELIEVETAAFERGLLDYLVGRHRNPFDPVYQPDAYSAWGVGQDAAGEET